ncbi:MbcA/ParS/Xre antitoxin family protein [Roseateles sp. PN1]|uniref:MbcA/ParS/Xre antitoxin family protein n=1 Tax=Roseateles sp. PN1 TaxID=3137372 RepID=UPI003139F09A
MNMTETRSELLGELRRLLQESGRADNHIDLSAWLDVWLEEPSSNLGGATPAQALLTPSGLAKVKTLLERMRGGLPG